MAFNKQGWGFIIQWSNDRLMVKAGFTTASFSKVLLAFAKHSPHRLVVVKAWETTKEDYELVATRLEPFVTGSGWMKATDGLQRLVREDLPCDSLRAKAQFKRACGDAIAWMPWLFPSEEFIPMPVLSQCRKTRYRQGAQSIIRSSGF